MIFMIYFYILFALLLVFLLWRFFYFFRDPERTIPNGRNIVSVADGTVVYIRNVNDQDVPISIKNKSVIKLHEILQIHRQYLFGGDKIIIGVFMHPTSVHVNRAPISGKIIEQKYISNKKNLPMTLMWWRVLLKLKPYEKFSTHILENERNIIHIVGDITISVIQIADVYVNKIVSFFEKGDFVKKGERIGVIKMGSQVDIILPADKNIKILIKEGEYVYAGSSIIAEY